MQLTITQVGDDAGLILPQALLARFQLKAGDTLYVSETSEGLRISSHDLDLAETVKIAQYIMRDDHRLLQKLAE
jgi:putative addiction module antidote